MWPDVSQCFVIFHDFLRRIGSLMRLAVSWSPRRRIAALVFSGKPRPSSVCFSIVYPTWILQPTPNQHRQPDQVLSSFISKELRSPQQELLHFWSHHRALRPKHPVTFRWNMVQHRDIEFTCKAINSVLSASNGKTLWVQEVPQHQALLFVGTSKCSLTGEVKTLRHDKELWESM